MKNIAFITDMHLDESFPKSIGVDAFKNLAIVLNDLKERSIDTIIIGGDIGESHTLEPLFNKLHDYDVYAILGNHDRYSDVAEFLTDINNAGQNELYYSFEEENNKLIFMDSSSEYVSDMQLQWLDKQLLTEKNILIFIHHPILTIDTAIDKMYPLKNREIVLSKIEQIPNKINLFSGHYHMEDSLQFKSNITQYVTPAVSYQVIKNDSSLETTNEYFGYRIIKIEGETLHSEIVIFK